MDGKFLKGNFRGKGGFLLKACQSGQIPRVGVETFNWLWRQSTMEGGESCYTKFAGFLLELSDAKTNTEAQGWRPSWKELSQEPNFGHGESLSPRLCSCLLIQLAVAIGEFFSS